MSKPPGKKPQEREVQEPGFCPSHRSLASAPLLSCPTCVETLSIHCRAQSGSTAASSCNNAILGRNSLFYDDQGAKNQDVLYLGRGEKAGSLKYSFQ